MLEGLKAAIKRLWRYRSSITGRFVRKDHADENPTTTQRERDR